jgi:hypothetical protein
MEREGKNKQKEELKGRKRKKTGTTGVNIENLKKPETMAYQIKFHSR